MLTSSENITSIYALKFWNSANVKHSIVKQNYDLVKGSLFFCFGKNWVTVCMQDKPGGVTGTLDSGPSFV